MFGYTLNQLANRNKSSTNTEDDLTNSFLSIPKQWIQSLVTWQATLPSCFVTVDAFPRVWGLLDVMMMMLVNGYEVTIPSVSDYDGGGHRGYTFDNINVTQWLLHFRNGLIWITMVRIKFLLLASVLGGTVTAASSLSPQDTKQRSGRI